MSAGAWGLAVAVTLSAAAWAQPASDPPQVPLCMIGDSITWAGEGDYWRQYLLEHLPNLAFVGTHSAVLGYSHAGEGGNSTRQVLARMAEIPACPYYHLLIGTNDAGAKSEEEAQRLGPQVAGRIIEIVGGLLAKPSVQKVFLGSVLPCQTDNPFRDRTNHHTNAALRARFAAAFPAGKVVWVEYEDPLRATPDWGPMILLHPTKPGYQMIARLLAQALRQELGLPADLRKPVAALGAGVRVTNLWAGGGDGRSTGPLIAGWYTLSCRVQSVAEAGGEVRLSSTHDNPKFVLNQSFRVPASSAGQRLTWNFFTGYAGYGYTTAIIQGATAGCTLEQVLLEKRRPSGLASQYGEGSYVDAVSPWQPGELLEQP